MQSNNKVLYLVIGRYSLQPLLMDAAKINANDKNQDVRNKQITQINCILLQCLYLFCISVLNLQQLIQIN